MMSLLCASCFSTSMDGIGNTMQKKAAELERLAEVLITGEQLRCVLGACSCPDRAGSYWCRDMHEEERVLHARRCPALTQSKLRCSRKTSQCSLQQDPAELRCPHNPATHPVAPVTFERGTINSLTRYYDPTLPIHSKGTVAPQRLAFRTL